MRRTILTASFLIGASLLSDPADARDRRYPIMVVQPCVSPAAPQRSAASSNSSTSTQSGSESKKSDPSVERIVLGAAPKAPFRLCIACPLDAQVIVDGRLTKTIGTIREYDLQLPDSGKPYVIRVVVLDDSAELLLDEKITAVSGLSETVLIPRRKPKAQATAPKTAPAPAPTTDQPNNAQTNPAGTISAETLQKQRDALQDARDKLQRERDELQVRRDKLQAERDTLQISREKK